MIKAKNFLGKVLFLSLISLCAFLTVLPVYAHAMANKGLKTYVVYDSPGRFGEQYPVVDAFIEYLGHFDLEKTILPLEEWQPGMFSDAEIVIFLGLKDTNLSQEFLQDLSKSKKIVWFEKNIEQLATHLKWQDFAYQGYVNGWTTVAAPKQNYISNWMEFAITKPGSGAEIYANLKNLSQSTPLSWRRDNVYYCGRLEFAEYPFIPILVDFLYNFIPEEYTKTYSHPRHIMLRIEDVSPLVRPDAVHGVIDEIKKHNVPFAIGVIPVGMMRNQRIYLYENQELVKVLKNAQDNGASIIMHGYTHQNEFSPTTGEGYEFWNATDDKPMDNDEEFTRNRIEAAFLELARCGLYPVAFEPPHYAMSKKGYEVLSDYFNMFSGEIQISDKSSSISLSLPYIVKSTYLNGMIVIPENMGYYDGHEFLVEGLLQNSKNLLRVKDHFACFFYHGYLPNDKIGPIIEGVKKQGYTFFDLRSLPIKAGSPQVKIIVDNGNISAQVDPQAATQWSKEEQMSLYSLSNIGFVHIGILVATILFFLFIIFRLRKNANKKYEV